MDAKTIRTLIELNNGFYRENADSFSRTRRGIWPGWNRVKTLLRSLAEHRASGTGPGSGQAGRLHLLDVACGNLRFERFCAQELQGCIDITAVDNCETLSSQGDLPPCCRFAGIDVLDALLEGTGLADCLADMAPRAGFDAACSFGFLHHVPTHGLRVHLLNAMLDCLGDKGLLIVTLWRFAEDADRRGQALQTTKACCRSLGIAGLEAGDYVLGWNNVPGAWRYCHSFSDEGIERLICDLSGRAALEERFRLDGKRNDANEYLVFAKS